MLELVGIELGVYSISRCFKSCSDGLVWIFIGVYSLYLGVIKRASRWDWGQLRVCGVTCGVFVDISMW